MKTRIGIIAAVAALCACGGAGNNPAPVQQTVGMTGGTVKSSDGSGVLIPAGALTGNTMVTVSSTPDAPTPMAATIVGTPYTFGPEGQLFAVPVTVTLAFEASKLPAGKSAADLVIFTAPAGSSNYVQLATTVVDSTHVSAQTMHFSTFAPGLPGLCGVTCGVGSQSNCGSTATSGGPNSGSGPSSGTPDAGNGCTTSNTACGCYAQCHADGTPVSSCGSTSTMGSNQSGGPVVHDAGAAGGNGGGGSNSDTGGGSSSDASTTSCDTGNSYALECDQNGNCICSTNGTQTAVTMTSCSSDPTVLFQAFASACGYHGIYAPPVPTSSGSGGVDAGTNGPDGGHISGNGPDGGVVGAQDAGSFGGLPDFALMSCGTTADCPSSFTCVNNVCVQGQADGGATSPPDMMAQTCATTANCPQNEICLNLRCVMQQQPPDLGSVDQGGMGACTTTSQCATGYVCESQTQCVMSTGQSGQPCGTTADCATSLQCQNGHCIVP